ncbi:MarR family transcriptional regulator [Macrococcoides bohemicum]|uniref:MarR family winged helix-turn-helix transcriptional regulator n=1 Tax=Macrococcoides bohemicum TaxID=1903056 RepID=UPI001C5D751C|nr:MarR family transcriptional regulator [Macrococcus bohemicus]QYA45363.1 MarR family transcriptional regulator [Macrococcus bohemicus]
MLQNSLDYQMYLAQREIIKFYNRNLLKNKQLSYQHYLVLMVLHEEKVMPVLQLGERLSFQSGTITPILKKMEARGIVSRHRSDADERIVMIQLTEEGESLVRDLFKVPFEMFKVSKLEVEDYKKLMAYSKKIVDNVTYE